MTVRAIFRSRMMVAAFAVAVLGTSAAAQTVAAPDLLPPPPLLPASAPDALPIPPPPIAEPGKLPAPITAPDMPTLPAPPSPVVTVAAPTLPVPTLAAPSIPAPPTLPAPASIPAPAMPDSQTFTPQELPKVSATMPPLVITPAKVQAKEAVKPVEPIVKPVSTPTLPPPRLSTPTMPDTVVPATIPAPVLSAPTTVTPKPIASPTSKVPTVDLTSMTPATKREPITPAAIQPPPPTVAKVPATQPTPTMAKTMPTMAKTVPPMTKTMPPAIKYEASTTTSNTTTASKPSGGMTPGQPSKDGMASYTAMLGSARAMHATVRDYSGYFMRQERVRGTLLPEQTAELRVKTMPRSVAIKFISPTSISGQEIVSVAGKHAGMVRFMPSGGSSFQTIEPNNTKLLLTEARRVPTEMILGSIIELLERNLVIETRLRNSIVVTASDYTFDGRPVTRFEVTTERPHALRYAYRMVIYVDPETKLPVRIEAYDQPNPSTPPGGELLEAYSFVRLKFNQGIGTDPFEK